MKHGLCSSLLIAMLAFDSALLSGQSNPLTPSLRTERANTVLRARIKWLEDTAAIDPCSILQATGDTGFVDRLDVEVRSRLLDVSVSTACTPLGGGSPIAHVQLLSVTGTQDAAVVTLLVHGRGIGSLLQRHRFDATNGWRIEIEFPVAQHDRAPRPAPPDTSRAWSVSARDTACRGLPELAGAHRDIHVFRGNRLGFLRLEEYRIDQIWIEDPVSP
jgi:hypothetical protein